MGFKDLQNGENHPKRSALPLLSPGGLFWYRGVRCEAVPAAGNTPNYPKLPQGLLGGARCCSIAALFFFFFNFPPSGLGFPMSSVPEESVARGRVEHGAGHGASSGSRFLEPGKVHAATAGRSASSHRGRICFFGGASEPER